MVSVKETGNNARGEKINMRPRNRGLCRRWSKSSKAFQRAHEQSPRHLSWLSRKISTGFFPALPERFLPSNPAVTHQWTWRCRGCIGDTFCSHRIPAKRHPTNLQTTPEAQPQATHLSWKAKKKKKLTPHQATWLEKLLDNLACLGQQNYRAQGVNNARGETGKETILMCSPRKNDKHISKKMKLLEYYEVLSEYLWNLLKIIFFVIVLWNVLTGLSVRKSTFCVRKNSFCVRKNDFVYGK